MNRTASDLRRILVYLIPVLIAAALKSWIIIAHNPPFNADEAIVALMARHINQGQLPIFFYGQKYMGSLDAILAAAGFRAFGENVQVIRWLQAVIYLGVVVTTGVLAKRTLGSLPAALCAGLLVSLPPVNVVLYTTVSLGGYTEMLLIGNLLLLSGIPLAERLGKDEEGWSASDRLGACLWGLGAGFAFWVFGLSLVFILPILFYAGWLAARKNRWRQLALAGLLVLAGGLIGSLPWWFEAVRTGDLGIVSELAGGALAEVNQGIGPLKPLTRLVHLFVFGGTVMLGLRPPWSVEWLVLPLLPVALVLWMVVFLNGLRLLRTQKASSALWPLAGMGIVLALGFIFTPYGDDPSGRYFLPLVVPMAVFGAAALVELLGERPVLAWGLLALVLAYQLGGTLQAARTDPPGLTTQFDKVTQVDQRYLGDLVEFLRGSSCQRGYSNYWVSYPLAFQSGEELIFVPRLPYHEDFRYTARDDRYLPYTRQVEDSDCVAYITSRHPDLDEYLRQQFQSRNITWSEKVIGDYHIFYDLSALIHADQIGLGRTTNP